MRSKSLLLPDIAHRHWWPLGSFAPVLVMTKPCSSILEGYKSRVLARVPRAHYAEYAQGAIGKAMGSRCFDGVDVDTWTHIRITVRQHDGNVVRACTGAAAKREGDLALWSHRGAGGLSGLLKFFNLLSNAGRGDIWQKDRKWDETCLLMPVALDDERLAAFCDAVEDLAGTIAEFRHWQRCEIDSHS